MAPRPGCADGRFRRSSVRPYPREEPEDGLHREDVDGDGRVLFMRIEDPNGSWKPHSDDARAADRAEPGRRRRATSTACSPKGRIHNWDGVNIPIAPPLEGLDLNRNWPADWAPEAEQQGAGPFPTSEPEVRALVEAIVARKNITSYIGVPHVLRRPSPSVRRGTPTTTSRRRTCARSSSWARRRRVLTGYPAISIFHDFKYHPKMVIKGGDVDWVYDHLWRLRMGHRVLEPAAPGRSLGIPLHRLVARAPARGRSRAPEAGRRARQRVMWTGTRSSTRSSAGSSSAAGALVRFWFNPPLSQLEEEVKPHADFAVFLALSSPRLEIREFESEPVGEGAFRLRLVLENAGWLPTNVTEKALERKGGASRSRPSSSSRRVRESRAGSRAKRWASSAGAWRTAQVTWWGTDTLDEEPREGRVGGRGEVRRARRRGRAPPARRDRSRRRHALELLPHVHVLGLELEELGERARPGSKPRRR